MLSCTSILFSESLSTQIQRQDRIVSDGTIRGFLGTQHDANALPNGTAWMCRSVNMMDESFLIETVKEAACFVSQDVRADLKLAHSRDNPYRSLPENARS